ncbi:hypothetical protein [Salinivibrio sp. ML290]|uniref:hypothetical protein n=1 Tax=Salinivibrio sp. ML290 TaxID=1909468 RepID=UPI0009888BC1|nr:hypothetical protein [Salinivibrio sp. ML290]OOE73671.1 hypothetical protein BZG23_11260 [Salinivibrio sp. ML290]
MINRIKRSIKEFLRGDIPRTDHKPIVNKTFGVSDLKSIDIIFLVTVGRSGTKSFIDYLQKYSELNAYHAPKPCLATLGSLIWDSEVDEKCAQWCYFSAREKYLIDSYKKNIPFVDGDCKNLPLLPSLSEFFPRSKFLHITRNPVSFIVSGLNRGYFKNKDPVFWGHLKLNNRHSWALNFEEQVEMIADFWEIGNTLAKETRDLVGEERFITLRAEDFLSDSRYIDDALSVMGIDIANKNSGVLPRLNKNKKSQQFDREFIMDKVKERCPSAKNLYPELFDL